MSQGRWRPVWRALALFWLSVVLALGAGLAVLQLLGPPGPPLPAEKPVVAPETRAPETRAPEAPATEDPAPEARAHSPAPHAGPELHAASETHPVPPVAVVPASVVPAPVVPVAEAPRPAAARLPGAPVPEADPDLLERSKSYPDAMLPRTRGGNAPRLAYAAGVDPGDKRPRIALLMAGMGMSDMSSDEALRGLPPAISFAVAPYARQPDRLLQAARARGHEIFLSLPMEPFNYPNNDAGPQALLNGQAPAQNALRLEWSLSRFSGYVGVTGAMNGMHGERFVASPGVFTPVLEEIAARGLIYVDARPGVKLSADRGAGLPPLRDVDLIVDLPAVRVEIEAKLARLEQIARERGSALGLADLPTPVTTERIGAWTAALGQRGFILVPVSALVTMPAPAAP